MKRLFIILSILIMPLVTFANKKYDKYMNYQYNDATVFENETIYLFPRTGSWYGENVSENYHWFKSNIYDDGYGLACENTGLQYQYKFNPFDYRDYRVNGTHKRHIEGHAFTVNKVVQDPKYHESWTFYLTDLNTGDNLKYIYHGSFHCGGLQQIYPFITYTHYQYCASLIGTKLVFSTKQTDLYDIGVYYYNTFETDINTGEKINYSDSYAKWTIIDVIIDTYYSCLSFIVTDGIHTTKVLYNNQYSPNRKNAKENNYVRVFTEKQWNELVRKYGEKHMAAIMEGVVLDDMTIEEKYMAKGRVGAKMKNNNVEILKEAWKETKKVHKSIAKDYIEVVKCITKTIFDK